jgi:DNA-nicking Smr family endonuclease
MAALEDKEAFEKAMRGVDPIEDGKRVSVPARRRRRRPAGEPPSERAVFEVTRWGDHQQGVAAGTDESRVRSLELGDYPPQMSLDLHGVTEEEARGMVRDLLRRALRAQLRCVAVIHGRGLRSPDGPVLKRALPDWLAEPPHGKQILAFTTAGKYGTSGGATLVLLRRTR